MAKALPTNNEQLEITHIKIKLNNAGNAERLHVMRVIEGKAPKLLKVVREDFMRKELHLKGKPVFGQSGK